MIALPAGFEERPCPVCGARGGDARYVIHYRSSVVLDALGLTRQHPEVRLRRCDRCSHHFASPHLAPALLEEYYSNRTSEFYASGATPVDARWREHRRIVRCVSTIVGAGCVLDIGYGYGFLLGQFDSRYWTRLGVEPSRVGAQHAREHGFVDRHWNSLAEVDEPDGAVDIVLLIDVVEHLPDVRPLLRRAQALLRPGGLLVVGTGNVRSLTAILSRGRWGYFGSWEHLSFFSPASLGYALRAGGLSPMGTRRVAHSGGWRQDVSNGMRSIWILAKNSVKIAAAPVVHPCPPVRHYLLVRDHMLVYASAPKERRDTS